MKDANKIEELINEFFSTRFSDYSRFFEHENELAEVGIHRLERGEEVLHFLHGIVGNIEDKLYFKSLIPQIHPSPYGLIKFVKSFRDYIIKNQELIAINKKSNSDEIEEIEKISSELIDFFDYLIEIYESEELSIPYKDLRTALVTQDIDKFVEKLKSILSSVSYAISKQKEGHLHSNIHVILKMLGFDIQSEETTNIGRIDAVIRFTNIIYIFEFKNGTSKEALDQIEEKKYFQKFMIENKEIIGVGFGFDEKNISGHLVKKFN